MCLQLHHNLDYSGDR